MKLRARIHELMLRLLQEHTSPLRLATGVGLGAFIGSTPFFGFHTPIAVVVSRIFRLNVFAMMLGTQVSLPFLAPFLVFASVQLGHYLRAGEWLAVEQIDFALAKQLFVEWLLGSAVIGSLLGGLLFFATFIALRIWRRNSTKAAWTGRSRGTGLGYAIFYHTMRLLGRRGGYALLHLVTIYFFFFAWSARKASNDYLRRVLGPRNFFERQRDTWRHFQTFGRSLADRILIMAGGENEFTFEHENVERIIDAYRAGGGVVMLSAHLGSWAIAGDFLGDVQPTLVVYDNEAKGIREFFARYRKKEPKLIVINDGPTASLDIIRALREGELVAMLADRVRGVGPTIRLPFLGAPADFPVGPFLVAVLSGAPMIATFSMKEGKRHHHFFALRAESNEGHVGRDRRDAVIRERVEWYVRALEETVRRYPYQWYNFYDFWPDSRG